MGSKSAFINEQPAAQTGNAPAIVLNTDGYKSNQATRVDVTSTDFGAIDRAFEFSEESLAKVIEFADEAKDQAFAAAQAQSRAGIQAQELAISAVEAQTPEGERVPGGKVSIWALLAVVAASLIPYWLQVQNK